jgi:hypothetical protein
MILVPRDGHCMFRAIGLGLLHSQDCTHDEIRQKIINHFTSKWDNKDVPYAEWIRHVHANETQETYVRRMFGTKKDWGDHPELVVAAELFQHHVVVYEYVHDVPSLTETFINIPGVESEQAPKIMVIRVGKNHYHAGKIPYKSIHNLKSKTRHV